MCSDCKFGGDFFFEFLEVLKNVPVSGLVFRNRHVPLRISPCLLISYSLFLFSHSKRYVQDDLALLCPQLPKTVHTLSFDNILSSKVLNILPPNT